MFKFSWHLCQKSTDSKWKGFIFEVPFLSCSIFLCSYLCQYHIVLTAAALQKFWKQTRVEFPDFVLFQNWLGFLHFQIRINLLISAKMSVVGILIENALMYKSVKQHWGSQSITGSQSEWFCSPRNIWQCPEDFFWLSQLRVKDSYGQRAGMLCY